MKKGAPAECFRAIERRRLDRLVAGAAHVAAAADDDEHEQHCRNVGTLIANAETRCMIDHTEAQELRRWWVSAWAELRLRYMSPERRRDALLDPDPETERFLTFERRLEMLEETDEASTFNIN
jgi:hypothetical protein